MIKLLKFLITGSWHEHQYIIHEELMLFSNGRIKPWGKIIVSRCNCGKIKKYKISA